MTDDQTPCDGHDDWHPRCAYCRGMFGGTRATTPDEYEDEDTGEDDDWQSVTGHTATVYASGDGMSVAYAFPHPLTTTPAEVVVEPLGDARYTEIDHTSAGGTSVTVTFTEAPPAGVDNVGFKLFLITND